TAVRDERIDQRPAGMARRRVDDHAGGFIDDDEIAVLMNDREVCVFRLRLGRLGRRYRHGIVLALFDPQAGLFYRPARARYMTLLDEHLQACAREPIDTVAEHAVESLAGFSLADLDRANVFRTGHVSGQTHRRPSERPGEYECATMAPGRPSRLTD